MAETMYRASRYFRVLGNPTAYLILRAIARDAKTPSELAAALGRSVGTISATLRHLRQVNLVRYETRWKNKEYRLKDKDVLRVLDVAEQLADKMRKKRD
jgi:DNA-binding transcriptional ArsR family regulator